MSLLIFKPSITIGNLPARQSIKLLSKEFANQEPGNMDSKYESILLSKPFTFIIGPHKKQYMMHEGAVSRLSKPLDQLLRGGMRESKEKCVRWEDVDEKTFHRFGEWAYSGDYKPEEPEILLDASQIASSDQVLKTAKTSKPEPVAKPLSSFKYQDETSHRCKGVTGVLLNRGLTCYSCGNYFHVAFCSACNVNQYTTCLQCRGGSVKSAKKGCIIEKFNTNSAYASPTTPFAPRKNTESCEDYSEVFKSHARLYVLADKYDIKELRDLCVHRLWATLKEFVLYPKRVGDVVGLVEYTFQNTLKGDKLRTLMVEYCVCVVEQMSNNREFQYVINETPDFACELIKEISTRLV